MLTLARFMAWSLVALLVFVTLAPIDLRPVMTESANVERAVAYALLGLSFSFAYPRHRLLALCVVVGVAGILEIGQMLTQTRHGRVPDFFVKALAATAGMLAAQISVTLFGRGERGTARSG